jgi:citrate lyase beta subunit
MTQSPRPLQSLLFVPGHRPDRFAKALSTAAAAVCIDLEDAVAPLEKPRARAEVQSFFAADQRDRAAVRINKIAGVDGLSDLLMLAELKTMPAAILLPKISGPAEVSLVAGVFGDRCPPLIAIAESVAGVQNASAIATAPGCAAMLFGGGDYAAELGVPMSWDALLLARSLVVQACARAGLQAIDVPYLDLRDEQGLRAEAERIKALGFTGKAAIHPHQVDVINSVFRPSVEEVAEAQEAMAVFTAAGGAAVQFRGKLLEAPLVRRFRRILEVARDFSTRG